MTRFRTVATLLQTQKVFSNRFREVNYLIELRENLWKYEIAGIRNLDPTAKPDLLITSEIKIFPDQIRSRRGRL